MKGISTLIVLFMATQILFAQEKSMQEYISKDKAIFVANISPYKTYKKLDTATTNKYNISEMVAPMLLSMAGGEMSEEKIKKIQSKLANSKEIGLNTEKEVYLWLQAPENPTDEMYDGEPNPMFFNVVLPITDGKKFKTFLDELFGVDKTKNTTATGSSMNMIHNQMLLNWDKSRVILAGSTVQGSFFDEPEAVEARSKKRLMAHATALSKVDPVKSIAKDADYQQHLHKEADFDIWMDYNNFMPPAETVPPQARELYKSIIEFAGDMKIGGNGFFKKGEAEFLTEMYFNEAMARVMAKTYELRVNKDFFKYLDNSNLMGMFSMAMSPEGLVRSYGEELYKVLKKSKEGTIITNIIDIFDIFIDEEEIFTLLKGDMLIALTDIKIVDQKNTDFEYNEETDKWEEVTSTSKEMLPVLTMMMSYGSEENIMKFVNLGANAGLLSKRADGVWAIGPAKEELGFDVFIIVKDGVLMFTNDENLPENLKGLPKEKQLGSKETKDVTASVQYGFIDVAKSVNALKKALEATNDRVPEEMDMLSQTFKRMEMKVSPPNGNEMQADFRCILQDGSKNAIQIFVDKIIEVGGKMQQGGSRSSSPEEEPEEKGTKKM